MIAAHDQFAVSQSGGLVEALRRRRAGLVHALAYEMLVDAIKSRRFVQALGMILARPSLIVNLTRSAREHFDRPTDARPATVPEKLRLDELPALDAPASAWAAVAHRASFASEIEATGLAGAFALGFLPAWHTARLDAVPNEAAAVSAVLPKHGVTIGDTPDGAEARQIVVSSAMADALSDLRGEPQTRAVAR